MSVDRVHEISTLIEDELVSLLATNGNPSPETSTMHMEYDLSTLSNEHRDLRCIGVSVEVLCSLSMSDLVLGKWHVADSRSELAAKRQRYDVIATSNNALP